MTAAALWTAHRPLAKSIARGYFLPGADQEDVQQEALIALWEASRSYQPDKGSSFRSFAKLVIERRLNSCVRTANRPGRLVLTRSSRNLDLQRSREEQAARDRLWEVVEASQTLSLAERAAVQAYVTGTYDSYDRKMENALYRARKKLRKEYQT